MSAECSITPCKWRFILTEMVRAFIMNLIQNFQILLHLMANSSPVSHDIQYSALEVTFEAHAKFITRFTQLYPILEMTFLHQL